MTAAAASPGKKCGASGTPPPTSGCKRETRGVEDAAPYERVQAGIADGRVPSLRRVRAGIADGRVPSLRREGPGFVIARPALHKFRQPNMPR